MKDLNILTYIHLKIIIKYYLYKVQQRSHLHPLPQKGFEILVKGKIRSHLIQGEDHHVKKFAVRWRRAYGTAGVFSFEISNRKGGLLGDIAGNASRRQITKKTFSTIFLE